MKSIGFGNLKQQKDAEELILKVISGAGNNDRYTRPDGSSYVEYSMSTSS